VKKNEKEEEAEGKVQNELPYLVATADLMALG